AMPSSIRRPRSRNGTPSAANSAAIQPTAAPRISRPSRQVLQRRQLLGEGQRGRIGRTSTLVPSPIRFVKAAAQVRVRTLLRGPVLAGLLSGIIEDRPGRVGR